MLSRSRSGFDRIFEDNFPELFNDTFEFPTMLPLSGPSRPHRRRQPEPEPQGLTPSRFGHRQIRASDVQRETKCSICLEEFSRGETVCELPCKHIFHDACVREWLRREATCPVCRKVLGPSPRQSEERRLEADPFEVFERYFTTFAW
jgi:hypothetical protein